MARVLIDTNVLIYSFDQNDPVKQDLALYILEKLAHPGEGVLSVQGLAEFTSASLRWLHPPLLAAEVVRHVEHLAQAYPILDLTAPIVIEAARGVRDYKLSYYDAQLWATARLHQIPVIFSEDFASNISRETVRFINPFGEGFDITAWA